MGLLTDILKEIPQAAVLKEKIADIEAKYAASDTENAILRDDLREARAEIAKLKSQMEELSHPDLNEEEVNLLWLFSKNDSAYTVASWTSYEISERSALSYHQTRYYLHKLENGLYLHTTRASHSSSVQYSLAQKGREYLIKRGLL